MWFDDYHDDFDDDIDVDDYLFDDDVDSGEDDYIVHGPSNLIRFVDCVGEMAAVGTLHDDGSIKDDSEAELDFKTEGLVADHLSRFTNNPKYSDVILQVGKHLFPAHKIILCSWSEVFRKMFVDPSWMSCHQGKPNAGGAKLQQLVETEECADVFQSFLKFMYSETVVLHLENVYPILTLADKYIVQDLRDACEDFLLDQVCNVTCEEAMRGYTEAQRLGLDRVQDQCVRIFEANMNYLPESLVQAMSSDLLLRLLQSSDLVIEEENDVFKIALQWLNTDGQQEARKCLAREIFSLIRFQHMPSSRLKTLVDLPLPNFLEADIHPLLTGLVAKAFEWRALAAEEAFRDMDEDFIQPRMYLSQTFCPPSFRSTISHANSDSFRKMVVSTEEQDGYYNRQSFTFARQAEKNMYKFGKTVWEVSVFSSRDSASEHWSLNFVIQTGKDFGHLYRVAVMTRLTEEEEGDGVSPLITLHHGTVARKMSLTPSSTLKLSERPAKVWIKMVGFVDGKSESSPNTSSSLAAIC